MRQITLATGTYIVVHQPHPINTGGIPLVVDEVTVGRHLHRLITVGTCHGTDAMTASPYCHLSLAEMTIGPLHSRSGYRLLQVTTPCRVVSSAR